MSRDRPTLTAHGISVLAPGSPATALTSIRGFGSLPIRLRFVGQLDSGATRPAPGPRVPRHRHPPAGYDEPVRATARSFRPERLETIGTFSAGDNRSNTTSHTGAPWPLTSTADTTRVTAISRVKIVQRNRRWEPERATGIEPA